MNIALILNTPFSFSSRGILLGLGVFSSNGNGNGMGTSSCPGIVKAAKLEPWHDIAYLGRSLRMMRPNGKCITQIGKITRLQIIFIKICWKNVPIAAASI